MQIGAMQAFLLAAIASAVLFGSASGFAHENRAGKYVRVKSPERIFRVMDVLPKMQKFVIGGRLEIRRDGPIVKQITSKRDIGGRMVNAFARKHRMTLSNSPNYAGTPGYANMSGHHTLVWLADVAKEKPFKEQLAEDMVLFKSKLREGGQTFERKNFLLVVDDLKLPFGKAVMRLRGGYDGSHFLKEMAEVMDISEMPRLRVGIGIPAIQLMSDKMFTTWLHQDFDNLAKAVLPRLQTRVAEMIQKWVESPTTEDAINYCRTLPDLRSAEGISQIPVSQETLY